jgi:hypothetical protein
MFKWFNKKEEIKSQPYMPKVDDVLTLPDDDNIYLVVEIVDEARFGFLMDISGEILCKNLQSAKKTYFCNLSEIQLDRYYRRTPEAILERKLNERLKPLVSATELEHYQKVATIRDMIIKDLKS